MAGSTAENRRQSEELSEEINHLLEQYLLLLDQYTALRSQLVSVQASIAQNIARANFTAERGVRYGADCYDERMQALRLCRVRAFPPETAEANGTDTNTSTSTAAFTVETLQVDRKNSKKVSMEATDEKPLKENMALPQQNENKAEDDKTENTPRTLAKDPTRMFGILIPQALRAAQLDAITVVQDIIPKILTIDASMSELEIRIRRARKHKLKAQKSELEYAQSMSTGAQRDVLEKEMDKKNLVEAITQANRQFQVVDACERAKDEIGSMTMAISSTDLGAGWKTIATALSPVTGSSETMAPTISSQQDKRDDSTRSSEASDGTLGNPQIPFQSDYKVSKLRNLARQLDMAYQIHFTVFNDILNTSDSAEKRRLQNQLSAVCLWAIEIATMFVDTKVDFIQESLGVTGLDEHLRWLDVVEGRCGFFLAFAKDRKSRSNAENDLYVETESDKESEVEIHVEDETWSQWLFGLFWDFWLGLLVGAWTGYLRLVRNYQYVICFLLVWMIIVVWTWEDRATRWVEKKQ